MDRFRGGQGLAALAIALFALAGPAHAASQTVEERGTQFVEAQVDVVVGDSVTWVYRSSPPGSGHTVTFEDATLNSDGRFVNCPGLLTDDCQRSGSPAVTRTFSRVGTFSYYCKVHRSQGMTGVVVVSAKVTTSSSAATTSSTLARATTSSTSRSSSTSSTTPTTRELATSSTLVKSTTTTADTTSVLLPGDAPAFPGDGDGSSAAGSSGGSDDGNDSGTVVLIVVLLLGVAGGGGFLLWRLRPGRT